MPAEMFKNPWLWLTLNLLRKKISAKFADLLELHHHEILKFWLATERQEKFKKSLSHHHCMTPLQCVKSIRIRSFPSTYFPALVLNTERYGVSFRIQSECGKIRTRKPPNPDTFHIVLIIHLLCIRRNILFLISKLQIFSKNQMWCVVRFRIICTI